MYCVHCGSKIESDQRFCVNCGAAVSQAGDANSAPANQGETGEPRYSQAGNSQAGDSHAGGPQAGGPQAGIPQASTPQAGIPQAGVPQTGTPLPRKPKTSVYLLVAALVLVGVAVGVFAFMNMNGAGSAESTAASNAAPLASDGKTGQAANSGQTGQADPAGSNAEAQAQANADASAQAQADDNARFAAYLQVVKEYQSHYGEGKSESANRGNVTQLKGLFLVELVDFNADGNQELFLGYYDDSATTYQPGDGFADAKAYRGAIWGYENGNAVKLYEPGFHWTNGGFAFMPVFHRDNGVALESIEYGTDDSKRSFVTNAIWVMEGNSFNKITEFSSYGLWGTGKAEYVIDGKTVDEATYNSHLDSVLGTHTETCYSPMATSSSSADEGRWDTLNDPNAILKITRSAIETLEAGGFKAEDAASAGNAGGTQGAEGAKSAGSAQGSDAWAQFPQSFTFTSGAGGWATDLTVAADGTFTGVFHDSDLGDTGSNYPKGTRHEAHFEGAFTTPVKIGDYEYRMQLASLKITDEPGESIEDGVRVIRVTDSVYGLGDETSQPTGEFRLYLPGQPVSVFSDETAGWLFIRNSSSQVTDFYAIVNLTEPQSGVAFRTTDY